MTRLQVGIGQIVETDDQEATIEMIGLGSCAGIFLCKPGEYAVAAHALLAHPNGTPGRDSAGRFVETAIPALLGIVRSRDRSIWSLRATIVGGAHVFSFGSGNPRLNIGEHNISTALRLLADAGVHADAAATGGDAPRNARLTVATGIVDVQTGSAAA